MKLNPDLEDGQPGPMVDALTPESVQSRGHVVEADPCYMDDAPLNDELLPDWLFYPLAAIAVGLAIGAFIGLAMWLIGNYGPWMARNAFVSFIAPPLTVGVACSVVGTVRWFRGRR